MSGTMYDAAELFTLGAPFGRVQVEATPATAGRPFVMRAAQCPEPIALELDGVCYDPERQVAVIEHEGLWVPVARHTDGVTSTRTSDGRGGPDSDTDHRED